jgi:gliding motility-associated lipoprotein GldH
MRIFFAFIVTAVFFTGCDTERVYEKNYDFTLRQWLVNDTPVFEFEIADTIADYNLYFNIRNSVSFPFSRLFINYYLEDSAGTPIQKKLTQTFLFDKQTGKPFGTSGLGDIYDQRVPLISNYRFPYSGKFKMKFEQFMRTDTLQGVLAVGLRVEKKVVEE